MLPVTSGDGHSRLTIDGHRKGDRASSREGWERTAPSSEATRPGGSEWDLLARREVELVLVDVEKTEDFLDFATKQERGLA